MKNIAFSKTNESVFFYIDDDKRINMIQNWENVRYYGDDDAEQINANKISTSFNDDYILYTVDNSDTDMFELNIMLYQGFIRGNLHDIVFKFQVKLQRVGIVYQNKIIVSPNSYR